MKPITVITGASKGIGRALSAYYRNIGHFVFDISKTDGIDIRYPEAVRNAFSSLPEVTNLINCAGIASMNHCLLTPSETALNILEVNMMGTFHCIQEAARIMNKKKYGRIVNFSSVAVSLKLEGEAIYAASKAAVETMTKIMAKELGPMGITLNTVAPNPIQTDLIKGVSKEKIDKVVQQQAIKRRGTMEDVINVVDFFLRPESEFVTGQTIYLGGV